MIFSPVFLILFFYTTAVEPASPDQSDNEIDKSGKKDTLHFNKLAIVVWLVLTAWIDL